MTGSSPASFQRNAQSEINEEYNTLRENLEREYSKLNDFTDEEDIRRTKKKMREILEELDNLTSFIVTNDYDVPGGFESGVRIEEYREASYRIPMRRLKGKKTRSQHVKKMTVRKSKKPVKKTRKVRSQYAKKQTPVKRKGVKNYLSRVVSNVTDSVKNTGKAVLSPLRMKKVKKTRKVSKA
jgi:hypothetical protein